MPDNIDDLLTEATDYARRANELAVRWAELDGKGINLPKKMATVPDALVLITVDCTCRGCGREYPHPTRVLSLRYGTSLLRVRFWHNAFTHLPREQHRLVEESSACEHCFEKRIFLFEEENFPENFERSK